MDNNGQYEDDIVIGRSAGAKHRDIAVRLPDGDVAMLTEGTHITNVQTIAGAGRNRKIDVIDSLMLQYPESNEGKWQKKKGFGYVDYYGESYKVEIHWYEEPSIGQTDWKVKPDADGNWFYESE